MPSRNVDIDGAQRRVTKHITLQGLALDGDSADGTLRPEKPAHALLGRADIIRGQRSLKR